MQGREAEAEVVGAVSRPVVSKSFFLFFQFYIFNI